MKQHKSLLDSFVGGVKHIKDHPQLLFTLLIIIVIPLAFLFSSQQFLNVSRDNQANLENDRIGLLHDSFLSIMEVSDVDVVVLQKEIESISELNPDIVAFRVSEKTSEGFMPIAALNKEVIGEVESDSSPYNLAFTNPNDSLVENITIASERYLRGVRYGSMEDKELVILTVTSRENIDNLFESRIQTAYIWLFVIIAAILFLIIRHLRFVDYAYLYRETKKANEMKDLFTNMIAHELRTPLTAIRGYASLIREDDKVDDETKRKALRIEDSSQRLLLIINDLLDVARIQSGKLSVTKEEVNLSDVVVAVGEVMDPVAAEKGVGLHYKDVQKDLMITSDSKRLHQAITNLISNSIKYTPKGSIEIELNDLRDRVEMRVKDTGVGIAAEDQKKLFAPFFRVQNDDMSKITGTGLGMWITKQLIDLMDGSIGVESIKGVGTHIVVTLPKKQD